MVLGITQIHIVRRDTDKANASVARVQEMCAKTNVPDAEVQATVLSAYVSLLEQSSSKATELADNAIALAKKNNDANGEALADNLKDVISKMGADAEEGEEAGGAAGGGVTVDVLKFKINEVALSLMGSESLGADVPLMDAGLDSLSIVEFRNELVKEFPGVDLPGALLFDYPTVNSLAEFVAEGIKASSAKAIK